MKYIINIFTVALLLTFTSCDMEPMTSIGFNTSFHEYSSGLSVLHVSNPQVEFRLSGDVILYEGEICIQFLSSKGDTAYNETFSTPGIHRINARVNSQPAYWRLKYYSRDGKGKLNIHAYLKDDYLAN